MNRYLRNDFKFWIKIALLLLVLLFTLVASEQAEALTRCKSLNTRYSFLESHWRWLGSDRVVFSVSQGLPPNGITKNLTEWYQYQPSSDKLEQLSTGPYQTSSIPATKLSRLKDLQSGENGLYEAVRVSNLGDKFVYPRTIKGRTVYWYIDTTSNVEADLGLGLKNNTPLETYALDVFWTADEKRFIIQGSQMPNSIIPMTLVTTDGPKVTIKHLTDMPQLAVLGPVYTESGLKVVGLSPRGNLILIQPDSEDYLAWLYDLDADKILKLNFSTLDRQAAWKGDSSFVILSNKGVIEYDIKLSKMTVLATLQELNLDKPVNAVALSPDGKFLMVARAGQNGTEVGRSIDVCSIG